MSTTEKNSNNIRHMNTRIVLSYYVANLVGAGLLAIPVVALEKVGVWSLAVWGILIACSWPLAIVFSRIAVLFPDSSGLLRFIRELQGIYWSKTIGLLFLITFVIGNPIVGMIGARYFQQLFNTDTISIYDLAILIMIGSVVFNLVDLRISSQIHSALVYATLLVVLLALIYSGFSSNYEAIGTVDFTPPKISDFSSALAICFFLYLGWENVCTISPNVRDPDRTFKKAVLWAVIIVGSIYLFVAIILVTNVKTGEINGNYALLDWLLRSGEADYRIVWIANLAGFFLILFNANVWVLAASKLFSSCATQGLVPSYFAKGAENTPRRALIALGVIYAVELKLLDYLSRDEFFLTEFVSIVFIFVYLFVLFTAVFKFPERKTRNYAIVALGLLLAVAGTMLKMLLTIFVFVVAIYIFFRSTDIKKEKL